MRLTGLLGTHALFDVGRLLDEIKGPHEVRVQVRRPDDLLVFDLLFDNLVLRTGPPRLERNTIGTAARLIVELPPQSFAERAFYSISNSDDEFADDGRKRVKPGEPEPIPALPSAQVRMAGRSRVVFEMPTDVSSLDYTLAAVLRAMRTWPLALDISAQPDPDPPRFLRVRHRAHTASLGDWLATAVSSSGWRGTQTSLVAGLSRLIGEDIQEAVSSAAQRVAVRAAPALVGVAWRHTLSTLLADSLDQEVAHLSRRFPSLGQAGAAREASAAAVALAVTEVLSATAARVHVDIGARDHLGILPFLLAPHAPAHSVTALELPYRLFLSPIEDARWRHADAPVVHRERTELWHTRLTTSSGDVGLDAPAKVRATWSPDYPFGAVGPPGLVPPFVSSLDATDRWMLVQLMAGYNATRQDNGRPYVPRASQAKRLHLSALGGLLESEGSWNPRPQNVDLQEWRHVASVGRDHYVRVVYAGYLCHTRHAASLVKVTERKIESLDGNPNHRVAVLRQHFFIVVRERFKHYTGEGHRFAGHNFPFTDVEIITHVTPDLFKPGTGASALEPTTAVYGGPVQPRMVFWPMVPGPSGGPRDFHFNMIGTDITGKRIAFSMPLLFVSEVADANRSQQIRDAYNLPGTIDRRRADFGGATVCFAPFDPTAQGDPRLPTDSVIFEAGELLPPRGVPDFYPEVAAARVGIKPVQKLLGQPNAVVNVTYPQVYKDSGFDAGKNAGQVFLQLLGEVHRLEFGGGASQAKSDALGALAAPQMSILGLSRLVGPVAGREPAVLTDPAKIEDALGDIKNGRFDPAAFFSGATILGGVKLADVLSVVTGLTNTSVPKLVSREHDGRVESSFEWDTEINTHDPFNLLLPMADPGKGPTRLVMHGRVTTPLDKPADATSEAVAALNNFKVNLFGFIVIWFENLRFDAHNGRKPDVVVDLRQGTDAVQFGGPLEFVNTLREFIPSNGFSDPPSLTVTPSGISAAYSLSLPTIGVGVFSLANASLGAGFNLPFDSRPASVQFRFSERQHPFSLTVSLLGGGGFFGIGVSAAGVQEIEAALEFGAAVAIDLGVASGSVEIKAGVYFHWLEPVPNKGSVTLAGYVRIHGELSVLGIISVSLTFNLELGYIKESGESKVYGEATLVVEIDILFFSASVSVQCRREFKGAALDPKFKALIPDEDTWTEYCEAFAEEAA